MTEDDKFALKEFARGFGFFIAMAGVIILGIAMLSDGGDTETEETTKVVDTYKGCDIVRWSNHKLADYKYFLHCDNK